MIMLKYVDVIFERYNRQHLSWISVVLVMPDLFSTKFTLSMARVRNDIIRCRQIVILTHGGYVFLPS